MKQCSFVLFIIQVYLFNRDENVELPEQGKYATGIVFTDKQNHQDGEKMFAEIATQCQLKVFLSPVNWV